MGLFSNPLSHAGYPPGVTGTPTTQPSEVRAGTAAEVAAGILNNVYVSPATASSLDAGIFAAPPVLGSTTPNGVKATTLSSSGNTSLGTGASSVVNVGVSTSTIGFFGATAVVKPTSTTDLRTALINLGLYTTGGASPLNLNGGALSTGQITIADASNVVVGSATGTKFGTATSQKMGWYNATPVIQQTQTGAITNNVTSGGTTGTIANYTDLTTYANDSNAIRNDIYQLALGLQGCIAALRAYGFLA